MCPNCRAFITTDDKVCPYCDVRVGPPAASRRPSLDTEGFIPSARFTTVVILLINAGLYAATALFSMRMTNGEAVLDVDGQTLLLFGAKAPEYILAGQWWRLITAGFIHFGLIHIAFNMYALWALGTMLEDAMGRMRFLVLYMAALLAGSAGVLIVGGNGITGGASGAVFGLFGAAAVGLQRRGVNPLQTSIGTVLILNLVLTFAIPGISVGGHLGGLIGGAICGYAMFAPPWKRVPTWVVWTTPAAVIVVSVMASFAVSS